MIKSNNAPDRNERTCSNSFRRWLTPAAAALAIGMTGPALAQLPTISAGEGVEVSEAAGTAEVELTLSAASATDVTVTAFTRASDESPATPGEDYYGTTEEVTFAAGETSKTVNVTILDDAVDESTEQVMLRLVNPVNAQISDDSALISIIDDDGSAEISVSDASANESDGSVDVEVSLSEAVSDPLTVTVFTRAGSAVAGQDFYGKTEIVTFAAGETTSNFTVLIIDDDLSETPETFSVRLVNASSGTIADEEAVVTITDDEGSSSLSVADTTVAEDAGTAMVTVTLDPAANNEVSVIAFTRPGTATKAQDYYGSSQTLTFAAGETSKTFEVTLIDDAAEEPAETIMVLLNNAVNAGIAVGQAEVTIEDDDTVTPLSVSVSEATVAEGEAAQIMLTLSEASTDEVKVTAFTREGSATAGPDQDFYGQTTEVTFAPGETEAMIDVTTLQDDLVEGDEDFSVVLINPVNAQIGTGSAAVVIQDDDTEEVIASIGSAEVTEGTDSEATVEVTLSAASGLTVEVEVASREGTAISGPDYIGRPFTVTFAPGETSKSVSWGIVDDTEMEDAETFRTVVVSADNAEVGEGGTVTILDND